MRPTNNLIGKTIEVSVGPYSNLKKHSVTIVEEIGYHYLAKSESGKYCPVHLDFCGKWHADKLYKDETKARKKAEEEKYMMY